MIDYLNKVVLNAELCIEAPENADLAWLNTPLIVEFGNGALFPIHDL